MTRHAGVDAKTCCIWYGFVPRGRLDAKTCWCSCQDMLGRPPDAVAKTCRCCCQDMLVFTSRHDAGVRAKKHAGEAAWCGCQDMLGRLPGAVAKACWC